MKRTDFSLHCLLGVGKRSLLGHSFQGRSLRGFSMVEMLVTIAVIGILCGIALTTLSQPQRQAMVEATRQQNAAALASMAVCAEVAGSNPLVENDLEGTMRVLMRGIVPDSGPLKGHRFVVSGIEETEVTGVAHYLSIKSGELMYYQDGANGR